jgi:hypothetical protein
MPSDAFKAIEQISEKEIQSIIDSKPVVLVGSAISIFPPTNLSSGVNFVQSLFNFIFTHSIYKTNNSKWIEEEFQNLPFEAVMERYPLQMELPEILSSTFKNDCFNNYHKSLAEKLKQGKLHSIITPNYDLAFDKILDDINFKSLVCTYEDYESKKNIGTGLYFKIHGTAEASLSNTLVFTLAQERRLEAWKIELLKELTKDRTLLIIGYGGRDFDICPVIKQFCSYKKIIWVQPDVSVSDLTAYQEELINAKPENKMVDGDFTRFLRHFFKESIVLKTALVEFRPGNYFKLNDKEILEWQINILDRISCATFMKPTLEKLKGRISEMDWAKLECNLYGHIGLYKKAAKLHRYIAKQLPKRSDKAIGALLNTSGSWIGYGAYFNAYIYHMQAKKLAKKYLSNNKQLQFALHTNELVLFSKIQQIFGPFRRIILKKLHRLQLAIDKLQDEASIDNRQVIRLNFERLGISTDFSLLSSYKGYRNLGISGMAIIAYRHKIENNNWDKNETPLADLSNNINKAELLGMSTEVWKLCRIQFKKFKLTPSKKREVWDKWKKNLEITEYNFLRHYLERMDLYWNFLKIN